ncbi:hypothetical protein FACS1894106_1380 [Spirochaetia bacterium]|nr:hypothetical protein FACS1894106_1380 [Spirochaetia bacterium]
MVVCNVFGVNESWLLTGDGDMFVKKPEQVLPPTDPPPALSLVDSDGKPLKPDEAELIGIYQQLDPNNKVVVVKQAKVILEVQDAAKAKGQTG